MANFLKSKKIENGEHLLSAKFEIICFEVESEGAFSIRIYAPDSLA